MNIFERVDEATSKAVGGKKLGGVLKGLPTLTKAAIKAVADNKAAQEKAAELIETFFDKLKSIKGVRMVSENYSSIGYRTFDIDMETTIDKFAGTITIKLNSVKDKPVFELLDKRIYSKADIDNYCSILSSDSDQSYKKQYIENVETQKQNTKTIDSIKRVLVSFETKFSKIYSNTPKVQHHNPALAFDKEAFEQLIVNELSSAVGTEITDFVDSPKSNSEYTKNARLLATPENNRLILDGSNGSVKGLSNQLGSYASIKILKQNAKSISISVTGTMSETPTKVNLQPLAAFGFLLGFTNSFNKVGESINKAVKELMDTQ